MQLWNKIRSFCGNVFRFIISDFTSKIIYEYRQNFVVGYIKKGKYKMSKEAEVGRVMFDIKDMFLTHISNTVVESCHRHGVTLTTTQRDRVLSDVQTELERLFNNATDTITRTASR